MEKDLDFYILILQKTSYVDNNLAGVGIKTVINETHEIPIIIEELGFIGGIVDSDFQRRQLLQQGSIDNVVQPGQNSVTVVLVLLQNLLVLVHLTCYITKHTISTSMLLLRLQITLMQASSDLMFLLVLVP